MSVKQDDLFAHRAGGDVAGPAHEKRLAETALPLAVFLAAQIAVDLQAGLDCGLAVGIARRNDATVVAGENDERVSASLSLSSVASTWPTLQSSSLMKSPYLP